MYKKLSLELMDIGLFFGKEGLNHVKTLPIYQSIDSMVNLEERFALAKNQSEQLYTLIGDKVRPLAE